MFAVYPLDSNVDSAASFARRKARASGENYECRFCQRSFGKQYNLLIHELMHKQSSSSSSSSSSLTMELGNEGGGGGKGQIPAVCDYCGKMFRKSAAMRNHRVSHSPPSVPKELKGFLTECITY